MKQNETNLGEKREVKFQSICGYCKCSERFHVLFNLTANETK